MGNELTDHERIVALEQRVKKLEQLSKNHSSWLNFHRRRFKWIGEKIFGRKKEGE